MSKPISDGQIYGLMWARACTYGMFSELHDPAKFRARLRGRR